MRSERLACEHISRFFTVKDLTVFTVKDLTVFTVKDLTIMGTVRHESGRLKKKEEKV